MERRSAADLVRDAFVRRTAPGRGLAEDAEAVARACHDMARRFHRGGRLLVFGEGSAAADAQHVAVEFVHPVLVGRRALPAVSLAGDAATLTAIAGSQGLDAVFSAQLRLLASPADIALGLSADGRCASVLRGLETAAELGALTVALVGGDGGDIARGGVVEHCLIARSADPCVVKEIHVTTYHLLWELVHVFFDQSGLLEPEAVQ
ncbi:D-sedoheptulose 7-phosphate isomerase [Thermomonospora echinospora]|uniref:D-sedoheptulose 7-phosphate isomerase n=1 Tax=Thermomonospora echinospora TaxID=1992 RepID=A0A1H6C8J7_9ACTN|nr:SIS domain-containing protein [Thermomonospora echinospora]SEG68696.1 D-sedoheptulose 7-phosphate isomerase [Thermomonospora echinospora]